MNDLVQLLMSGGSLIMGAIISKTISILLDKALVNAGASPVFKTTIGTGQEVKHAGIYVDLLNPKNKMHFSRGETAARGIAPDGLLQRPTSWRLEHGNTRSHKVLTVEIIGFALFLLGIGGLLDALLSIT